MAITIDFDAVARSIAVLIRADVSGDNGNFQFTLRGPDAPSVSPLTAAFLKDIAAKLGGPTQSLGDTSLGGPQTYEVLVSEETHFGFFGLTRNSGALKHIDAENGLDYRLGPPTDEFLIFFLDRLAALAPSAAIRSTGSLFRVRRAIERGEAVDDVLDVVRLAFPRLLSCRVNSVHTHSSQQLAAYANAYLFQLTYNLNVAFVETRSLDEFIRTGRLASMRRSLASEIEPPKRTYIRDLTYHYQLGVSAESPMLEYLSFYHVAEHFFEDVFHDDLIEAIRDRITRPEFSTKRKKDIHGLVREINRRQRIRDDTITFSEQEALRLTLTRFVNLADVRSKLAGYDKAAQKYFRTSLVAFCDGVTVDLDASEPSDTYTALAKRIYKTRNAIVHSKDGDKSRFVPFRDDDELAKEVPLMRFIAEEIIISTSRVV